MALSNDIISQFVELTNTSNKIQNEASVYGTIVTDGMNTYVKLDGSEQLTPIETTTNVAGGERVIVRIKDHKATVTGNITSPSVNNGQLEDVKDQISEFEVVIADRVTANEIVVGRIEADNVIINKKLTAIEGEFETIKADNITINEKLTANKAAIADLDAKKLSAETADLKYATIGGLNAANAEINDLKANHAEFSEATIKRLEADEASIKKLDAEKLSAKDADIKYANIDFANINMAAVEKLFAESGIIKDLVVGDTSITGELVGVTIKGDLIEANTLVADKLVIKGSDGLYYKLNTDGMTTEAEQTEYNSLNGSIITAKSITATKISVDDLVAFDATIGGFNITSNSIYSGVKSSVDNTTKGVYLDKDGQIAFGDSNNFLKFFRDTDGKWKLNISANSLKFSTSDKTVEEVIEDIDTKVQKTVKTVADYYASSSSATTKPITGWQTTPPEWVNGKFIWAKTKTTYTDDTSSESEPVCITGAKGDTGKPGADGSSGVGISSVDVEYYLSTSSTALAGGSWSTNSPTWVDGKYMWSRTKTTTTDGKSTTSEPVCITGGKGATGSNGVTGQGVESITEEYYLSTSKTTQSGGSWVTTPPTWSSGKYLWTRSKIVYKNPTETSYTKPVCDNSWEAVNEIEIGGRNLLRDASNEFKEVTFSGWDYMINDVTEWKPNDMLVGRVYIKPTNEEASCMLHIIYEDYSYAQFRGNIINPGEEGYSTVNISVPERTDIINIRFSIRHSSGETPSDKVLFKEAKVEKGNKATDWTPAPEDIDNKIDSIEIGGRNLLQNSNFAFGLDGWYKHDYHTVEIVKDSTYGNVVKMTALDNNTGGIFKVPTVNFKKEEVYTMSVYIKSSVVGSQIGIAIDGNGLADGEIFTISVANEWVKLVSTFKTSGVNPNIRVYSVKSSGCIFHITNIKVEKGNKDTDWTPAPEDVEANINNLEDTMNGAFKDGILSESEKKAIKQSLNIIKGDMTEADKIYETLNKNSNLVGTPKTNLYEAKMSYNNAYTSLVSFINTALSASIVTEEMKKSIDSAFGTYRTELGIFNTRVQEAIDAINSKKVDNIKIGGRNLILDSSDAILTSKNQATKFITLCDDILNIINSSIGKPFILSVDVEVDNCTGSVSSGNQRIGAEVSLKHEDNTYSYVGCWIKPAVGDSIEKNRIYGTPVIIRKKVISVHGTGLYNQLTCNNSTISKPKFEIGNKATDWTPAPEDVENSMNNKIDNIKIGGRNLLINSGDLYLFGSDYPSSSKREKGKITVVTNGRFNSYAWIYSETDKPTTYLSKSIKDLSTPIGKEVTFSIDIKTIGLTKSGVTVSIDYRNETSVIDRAEIDIEPNKNNQWIRYSGKIKSTRTDNIKSLFSIRTVDDTLDLTGVVIEYRNCMIEEGNKATDWTPAPEDIKANIDNLEDTMNGAFKDEILSDAEKKAIKQSLNIIKGDAEEVQKQYDTVYNNSNLIGTPKSNLLTAKTSYNSAYNSLISFINTALSASTVTDSMITSIDSAFGTYRTALGTFNTRLQEAIDSINSKKVDNIKIGGENLIFREKYWQTTTPSVVQLTAEPEYSRIRIKKVTADTVKHTYLNFVKALTKGKTYTLSYDITTDMPITSTKLLFLRHNGNEQALQYMKDQTVSSINTWIHKELTFVCDHSGTDDISIDSLALSTSHFNEGQTILFRNVKLEEGNKATTYSYAPEDERLESSRAGVNMLPNTKSLIVTGLTGVNYKYERRDIVTTINLKPFTIYTVSFKCKVLSGSTTKCSVGVTNSKIATVYQRGDLTITDDRMSWSFYTRNATDCSTLLFYAGQAGQTGTNKVEYSEIMLEETSIASEKWIPNAGDVDYVIESKKVAINNLILNTKNMKDTSGWTGNIGVTRSGVLNEPVFYNITTTTSEAVSGTSRFRVKPNTKYCFSMLLNINYSCSSVDVWWIAKFKDSTNDYDNTIRFIAEWQEARDKYARVVGTFITGPNDYDGYIRIDNNGKLASATGNSSIYWTEAMVAEGDVFSGYSPSIKDMDLRVTKAESDLIVVNNAISAKVWGEDINVALGRQADNLVRNGNGGTKDNSNFSKYTFVGNFRGSRDYPSFLKGASPYFAPNDDRIYIDRSKDYILSYEIRAKLADAKNKIYFAIDCYDIDGYSIPSYNNLFISKTTTKLKKELNNGDMTIEVESLSNWLTASSIPAYQRSVIFWNYKDSTGYQYPKETYSRNSQEKFGNGLWDSISDEDKSSGIIRLKNPWSGGSYPIGTEISQGNSGATYMYVGAFGVVSFNDRWIPYNVTVPGSSFRPGTAFIKMGLYGGQPTYISNLYFGIDRATSGQLNDLSNTVTNVQKTVSQHTIDLSGITSKVEKIESSDFQVHNLQRHSGGKYKDAGIEAWSMSGKDTLSWFTNYGSPGTFEDYYDLYKGGSSGAIYAYSQSPIPVTDGEKYTVSFNYGRSAVGGATHRFVIQCSNTYPFGAVTKKVIDRYMPSDKANEIIRQEFQFTIPADTKSIKVALANSVSGEGQSCSFYIDKIMINKGLVAYDWSPHEYDIESQFKSVEQKITAESILTTISSGINGNKGTISTMQFLLDKDGATIRNGALKILNNAGTTVLSGDSNGNISMTGVYKNVNSRNLTSFKIADSTITFFDGRSEGEKMGTIFSGYMQTSPDKATSLTIGHYLDASLRLSYGKADSNGAILFYPYVELDIYNINGRTNEKVGYPITIIQPVIIQEKSMVCSPMAFDNWGYNGRLEFYDYRLYGGNLSLGSVLNGRVKGSTSDIGDMCFLGRRGSNPKANAYAVLGQMLEGSSYDYNRNVVTSSSGTTVYGNFYVNGGTKNRIVTTNDFGVVKMNAYETSGCYFGDIGNGLIGEDGTCIIAMDIIYLETVNTKCDYFVFLQKYGSGDLWVEDRDETYFIVKGTPGMKFAWEVKARQRGYETDRLDQKLEDDGPATTYGCELTDRSQEEMEKLLKSMEEE